jgi:iron complex outermembrane receptor protein
MRTIKTCTVGLASLLITGFGMSASAAEKGDELGELDSMMLEEIVVTARRREESVQTVPVAVTAITADDLINRSAFLLSDIAKETPSITIQARQGDQNTQIIQLRGQVQGDAAATLDPSVGLYLNDIYVSRNNGANFELFDVERVEILAGPQGTLYGRNTTGGAIKLVTTPADLKGKMGGYASAGVGNYNSRRVEGAVNLPFSDNFAVRLAGLGVERDGYGKIRVGSLSPSAADPLGIGLDGASTFTTRKVLDTDNKNTKAGRLSATFEPMEKLSFSFVGDYTKQATNGTTAYDQGATLLSTPPLAFTDPNYALKPYGNYTKCSNDFYEACYGLTPRSNTETFGAALTGAYETGIGTAKVIYGYRDVDGVYQSDLEGTPLTFGNLTVPTKTHQNTLEAQLQGQASRLDYTVGLYYFREEGSEIFNDFNFLAAAPRTFDSKVDNESKSIYGQTSFGLTKTVRLTTGLRYTVDDKGIDASAFRQPLSIAGFFIPGQCLYTGSDPSVAPTRDNCNFQRSDDFSHLSWTVGLDWQPVDGILAYIKASDGYRSGGQNVRGIDPVTQLPFNEETIRDVELGLKSRLADRVQLNLTYYHSKYSDIQVTRFFILPPPQTTTTQVINAGTADIDGVEAQSIIVATDNLSFDVTGSYTNVDYSLDNATAGLTPRFKGSLGTNLFFPMSFGDVTARVGYSYQAKFGNSGSKAAEASVPETVSAGRGLLDARVAMNLKQYNLTVSLFGTNLTDKQYNEAVTSLLVDNLNPDGTPIDPTAGPVIVFFNRIQLGTPRMFGLDIRKSF